MERMPDGRSDTWAVWKSAVLGLPDDVMNEYLATVEGYSPSRVAAFRASESAIAPDDWETSEAARAAVSRLFAFRSDALSRPGALADQAERGAAVPPADAVADSGVLDDG